jgi:hypothetical protein
MSLGLSALWLTAPGSEASRIRCENAMMMASCRSRMGWRLDCCGGWNFARLRATGSC